MNLLMLKSLLTGVRKCYTHEVNLGGYHEDTSNVVNFSDILFVWVI